MPNGMLRSALFGAIRRGRRTYLKNELLNSIQGIEILYTGERLDQSDLSNYENILHLARHQSLGARFKTTSSVLLKMRGKTDGGDNIKALDASISRLIANEVKIRQGRYTYRGNLIHEAVQDEKTKEWIISINPNLKNLYAPDGFTHMEWEIRKTLEGKQLAQWLYSFYSTHAESFPYSTEKLWKLSGSAASELKIFTQKLKKALNELSEIYKSRGKIFDYEIREGLVHVKKTGTESQQHYLEKRLVN